MTNPTESILRQDRAPFKNNDVQRRATALQNEENLGNPRGILRSKRVLDFKDLICFLKIKVICNMDEAFIWFIWFICLSLSFGHSGDLPAMQQNTKTAEPESNKMPKGKPLKISDVLRSNP